MSMAINSSFSNGLKTMSTTGDNVVKNPLTTDTLISYDSTNSNFRRRKSKNKSVYLSTDCGRISSLAKEKCDDKGKVLSSFQQAAKVYKSNSDEFKLMKKKGKKSNRKSVLTLPNEAAALSQSCTVSDMNDVEYYKRIEKPKPKKKRRPLQKKSQPPPNYDYEYHDRDAEYCSRMNLYLDCSSEDVVKNYKGDGRRKKRGEYNAKTKDDEEATPSDVWAVLRNINRFQFHPSPPMSDDSMYDVMPRKEKVTKKKLNRGVYETCRTEQFTYSFSNIEVSRDPSPSGSSLITVIDNPLGINICEKTEKKFGQNLPLTYPKYGSPQKFNVTSRKSKKSNVSPISLRNTIKYDTLPTKISAATIKPKETISQEHNSVQASLESNFLTVEVQTNSELEENEDNKSLMNNTRTHNAVSNIGTMCGPKTNNHNYGRTGTKVPLQRPLSNRVPWCNTLPRQNPNIPRSRPPMSVSPQTIRSPAPGLTYSKLQDNPRTRDQATTDTMHPLTQTAIKRIRAQIKFPIVILGRDELSGTFKVEEYDYPQFKGLEEHIWPFMAKWVDKPLESNGIKTSLKLKKPISNFIRSIETNVDFSNSHNQEETDTLISKANKDRKAIGTKLKPISRFRDNMMRLLYRKPSNQCIANDILPNRIQRDVKVIQPLRIDSARTGYKTAVSRETSPIKIQQPKLPVTQSPPTSPSKIFLPIKKRPNKQIWAKAKWASDFIENVICKIRNGTYYSTELQSKHVNTIAHQHHTINTNDLIPDGYDAKEVSVQVSEDFTPKVTIQKKKEPYVSLPGFDDVLPQLEIKSMTPNQIAVKHCIMNVLLQFDVNVPQEGDRDCSVIKRFNSCIPVPEGRTKVFKCKKKIVNAALPAELCSLIPKIMTQFLGKGAPVPLLQEEERNQSLSTISEYTMFGIREQGSKIPLLQTIQMSPILRSLRNGRYSKDRNSWADKSKSNDNFYVISITELPYKYCNLDSDLLQQPLIYHPISFAAHPVSTLTLNLTQSQQPRILSTHISSSPEPNLCMDLVPYTGNKMTFEDSPNVQNYTRLVTLTETFKTIFKETVNFISESFPTTEIKTLGNHVYVNLSIGTISSQQKKSVSLCINTSQAKLKPICHVFDSFSFNSTDLQECPEKQIKFIKHAAATENFTQATEIKVPMTNVAISKTRRKGHVRYVKIYKKCKSTSHITAERSSTPLNKVTNLDEFFQALGTGKLLSSVCDGNCGKKIMSYISDLKTFTTAITPRQALLVMMLANKKDTSNLVRFRAVILQGIAVNRITRLSELDMEVEVIEKEKLNNFPEYLDIPSLTENTQNNNTLLEELIWIAKTTASDYQRQFDKSSEKLLKALLGKRKRLNPSYLRVMARYVGLGLLRTPVTH